MSRPFLVAMLVTVIAACDRTYVQPPRHLVLVTIDTLRRDRLGTYGYDRPTSPNLDRLALRSIRFDDAVAQAISTPPSHASILTGLNPPSHGLRKLAGQQLAPGNVTIAEVLQSVGFVTAAFVSGLPLRREMGLDQGFQFYEDSFEQDGKRQRSAQKTNEKVRDWLGTLPSGHRVFLWIHYFDPHRNYRAPSKFRARFGVAELKDQRGANANPETGDPATAPKSEHEIRVMRALYDAEVSYTDASLGELFALLDETRILQEAIVAVVADHGECLGEHGYYWGHWDVFDETALVPMILTHPHREDWRGKVVSSTVGTIDIMPTVLTWLGVKSPPGDGLDLTPLIDGDRLDTRPIYTEQIEYFPAYAVRENGWTLMKRMGKVTLHNRATLEKQALLERALQRMSIPVNVRPTVHADVPESVAERLRALGYQP